MALYDGFFDAYQDEETGGYDRDYSSGDFTQYFGQIIGSGVCIHNAPDSFKVRLEDGAAVVGPGYLFIRGYWLKNDGDYTIPLEGTGTIAIAATLNMGKKMIELEARSAAQAYPDALVLALLNMETGAVTDTRRDTAICGVIDSYGEMSKKLEWATNYIDTEVEKKLEQAENDINEQKEKLSNKISEVSAIVDKIITPPIGTIKFSAAQNMGDEWLPCDGRFISQTNYPVLVQALKGINPGVEEFSEIANEAIDQDISNGVIVNERVWVFSNSAKTLYGVSLVGEDVKSISVYGAIELSTSAAVTFPIFLSIIGESVFLAQRLSTTGPGLVVVYANYSFDDNTQSISMSKVSLSEFPDTYQLSGPYYQTAMYVATDSDGKFCIVTAYMKDKSKYETNRGWAKASVYEWTEQSSVASVQLIIIRGIVSYAYLQYGYMFDAMSLLGYNRKNDAEMVWFTNFGIDTSISSDGSAIILNGQIKSREKMIYQLGVEALDSSYDKKIYPDYALDTMSIVGGSDFMVKYSVSSGRFTVKYIKSFNSGVDMEYIEKTAYISAITTQAKVFTDACIYIPESRIWLFFIGTGIVFTSNLNDSNMYGFLNTQDILGTISKYGYMEYDNESQRILIMGQDTSNTVKICIMKLYGIEDYVSNGVFLPILSISGIPAYIKAYEPGV